MTSWLLWWVMTAQAGFYLEGPPAATRGEVAGVVRVARAEGHRARVLRRYQHGTGWVFVAQVEGFEAEDDAERVAAWLAEQAGVWITVFSDDGPGQVPEQEEVLLAEAEEIDAASLLARAQQAHGTVSGGLARLQRAPAVVFRYRRHVPEGPTVRHLYARQADRAVLVTEVEEGEGTSSVAWVHGEEAWLRTGDAEPTAQDLARTSETLERFSPERVLAFALGFAQAIDERREFALLYGDGETELDGEPCWLLRYDGDQVSGPLEVWVAKQDHRLRQVRYTGDAGEVVHRLQGWKDLGDGLVVPDQVSTWRADVLVDRVEVLAVETPPELPQAWFNGDLEG